MTACLVRASTLPFAVALLAVAGGCGQACNTVESLRLTPAEVTIAVGQHTKSLLESGGPCSDGYAAVKTHWSTVDTAIVTLDSVSGEVVGRAIGDARVLTAYASIPFTVHVR